jgi:hypothetical protein
MMPSSEAGEEIMNHETMLWWEATGATVGLIGLLALLVTMLMILHQTTADTKTAPPRDSGTAAPREPLSVAAARLLTDNTDGTFSIRIPYEGNRIITVDDATNAQVIAKAAAAKMRLAAQ